jgi:CRISPR-associated protein Cst1
MTVAFPNSVFTQPAYNKQPEKRLVYAERVLRAYRADTPTLAVEDVFTGQPAANIPFDVKGTLKPGYTFRQHIPLLTGEGVINFHPGGDAGLPVSGTTMLTLQAFPLGCAKCGGRLLAVHSDNERLIYHFARTFLRENRKIIPLAQAAGSKKMPEPQYVHKTLLIHHLLEAGEMQGEERGDERHFSLTAYHLTNSGQGVKLDIYHLPLQTLGFLRDMYKAEYQQAWQAIVSRAWEVAPKSKRRRKDAKPFQPRRNWLYEDLFDLPGNARRFLRTYFLRIALRYARGKTDPRTDYSLQDEADLVSWKITVRFLRRIMNMDKERVEEIRKMGDQLAEYVSSQNERHFFRNFFTARRYGDFRLLLIKANLAHVRNGNPPIITLDPYIQVFEEGDELARTDWRLARDLVLIRMVEQLYEQGWLGRNVEAIPEVEEETTSA